MFESTLSIIVLICAATLLLALAGIATYLHWQLYLRRKRHEIEFAGQQASIAKGREEMITSLHIIAKSYLAEQVDLAEAGIRISRVMDLLAVSDAERAPFAVFDQVHERLSDIPIMAEFKALPKQEKRAHFKRIERVELEFQDFAKDAAIALISFGR
jgi:hypothetical protein